MSAAGVTDSAPRCNVADRLTKHAAERPDALAVVATGTTARSNGVHVRRLMEEGHSPNFSTASYTYLDTEATLLAHGLVAMGVRPGHRIALLVKPGIEFVTLVFAVLRSGATMVLVDSGLGVKNIVRCLESTRPDGFVGIPQAHALRVLHRKKFARAKLNVTVGRRWFWGGETLGSLRRLGEQEGGLSPIPLPCREGLGEGRRLGAHQAPPLTDNVPPPTEFLENGPPPVGEGEALHADPKKVLPHTTADDPAAIVFTSGSTGPPKGVLYRHETFVTQADEIQRQYGIEPGGVDLACFPLFGLFNVACGVTTVLPEMDFSRPASCDPKKLFRAANDWKVNQAFASPAVWDRLSRHAEATGDKIPTLKKVFSCGAPVPAEVIRRTLKMVAADAELHTPYGATESLPVATIEAKEILNETAEKTTQGAGVCVGRKFDSIEWRVIRITDDPIATIEQTEELPPGEIGELIVRGPQVSRQYLSGPEASAPGEKNHNALAKITDGETVWHRIGDVGYFDDQERFWYCGRKSQRVVTGEGVLFTECVEGLLSTVSCIASTALVGVPKSTSVAPVVVYEMDDSFVDVEGHGESSMPIEDAMEEELRSKWLDSDSQVKIHCFLCYPKLPTDIRHNSKINREKLAKWAEGKLRKGG